MVTMFTPLLAFEYQKGIVSAKTDREANVLSALTIYVLFVTVAFISIGLIIFNYLKPNTFEEAGLWIYLAIPLLFFSGLVKIVDAYNNRFEQYKLMSSIAIIRSTTSNFIKVILGFLQFNFIGLIIAQFFATIFGIKRQARYMKSKKNEIFRTTFNELKNAAIKYKVQPLFSMPGLFVTMGSFSILPILINSLYSLDETGYFALAVNMLAIPLTLVSTNVGKVFFRRATLEKHNSGNFYSTFISTFVLLLVISLIGFSILWFIAEPIFSLVFGQEWVRSGLFVKILIPLFAVRFIVTGLMNGFIISGKQLLRLIIQFFFIVEVFVIYIFARVNSLPIEKFLELINYSYLTVYLVLLLVLYLASKNKI